MNTDFVAPVRSGLSHPLYLYLAGLAVLVLAAFTIGAFVSGSSPTPGAARS